MVDPRIRGIYNRAAVSIILHQPPSVIAEESSKDIEAVKFVWNLIHKEKK